ncbi:MAG: biopolymer transporter ExbD [Desulfobacterales bacterium]|nr:biopolymer transporter ExbD [Desulfobacterales bacterium]
MKLRLPVAPRPRIEMIPLIDMVFLLLVFFIYAMLSMAVHRGLPVLLPTSSTAEIETRPLLSITVKADRTIYVNKVQVDPKNLAASLNQSAGKNRDRDVMVFADRNLAYEDLFQVLDQIRMAGLTRVSLQAGPVRAP